MSDQDRSLARTRRNISGRSNRSPPLSLLGLADTGVSGASNAGWLTGSCFPAEPSLAVLVAVARATPANDVALAQKQGPPTCASEMERLLRVDGDPRIDCRFAPASQLAGAFCGGGRCERRWLVRRIHSAAHPPGLSNSDHRFNLASLVWLCCPVDPLRPQLSRGQLDGLSLPGASG